MAVFAPTNTQATPSQMIALATAANAALRGDTDNIGKFSVAAGDTSATIRDSRCRAGRLAFLIPLDAAASSAAWYLSSMTRGSMTFTFKTAPGACSFGWVILGDTTER